MNAIDSAATSADHDALAAIRSGDTERYRELIERHERQVYAVAWSRLGDSELARDATQDAFIKAYRHLGSLRDGSRFGGWVNSIVRSISINLGIRHRKELRRRERWQLEHQHPETPADEAADPMSGESLRAALESLPPIHRECLVLFYLEGKSVAESAAALSLSEGTFKTRLHRARAALRDRMEALLEEGLESLRPPAHLAHSIMLALPATSGLGFAGGSLGAVLAKLLPAGFLVFFIPLIGAVSGVLTGWWIHRKERENFRDPDDFRVKSHRFQAKRIILFVGIVMPLFFFLARAFSPLGFIRALLPPFALMLALALRNLRINRSPFAVANAVAMVAMLITFVAVVVFEVPFQFILLGSLAATAPALLFRKGLPHTHDYNLFLRRAHGLLKPAETAKPVHARTHAELFDFARILGPRWLVIGYRTGPDSLRLNLPGVDFGPVGWLASIWQSPSSITLWTDGRVTSRLNVRDARALVGDGLPVSRDYLEEESAVASAVQTALEAFDRNDTAGVESALGQVPDEQLFKQAPEQAGGSRSTRRILFLSIVVLLGISFFGVWQTSHRFPGQLQNAVPIRMPAATFRVQAQPGKALFRWKTNQIDLLSQAVWQNVVLPPRSWWSEDALQSVVTNAITRVPFPARNLAQPASDAMVVSSLLSRPSISTLLDAGLLTPERLAELGYTSDACQRGLKALAGSDPNRWPASRLRLEVSPVAGESYTVLSSDSLVATLSTLGHLHCLDAIDPAPIVRELRASQVLTNTTQPERHPLSDQAAWNGLFLLKGWNPLEETWQALGILDRFHSVDSIDRPACIDGILRFHLGQGRFGVRGDAGMTNGIYFMTPAKDTYYAYESLRILGALDRVPDLATWRFLVVPNSLPPDPETGANLDWPSRWEAGVLQDRFNHVVADLKAGRPARSLTDPELSTPFAP
jgi:RNA polymerase sigma factor (sigma-70 family)